MVAILGLIGNVLQKKAQEAGHCHGVHVPMNKMFFFINTVGVECLFMWLYGQH